MGSLFILATAATFGLSSGEALASFSLNVPINNFSQIVEETELFGRAKWEAAYETSSEKLQKNEQNLDIEMKSKLSDTTSLKTIIRAIHETKLEKDHLEDIDVREFYFDIRRDWSKIRLGRQQVVWGKTDGLRLLDLINPQDFREFILDDFIDSRIPLWMVRTDLYVGDDTLQLLLIPDIRFNRNADPGDRFEPNYLKNIRALPLSKVEENEPATTLPNAEWGFRYSGFKSGWDYSLNYFYSWEDNPLFFSENINNQPSMIRRYKRSKMAGGSFSTAIESFVIRGELAYNMDKYFSTTSSSHPEGQVQKNETKAALGLDYTIRDWTLSGQVFEGYIINYEAGMVNDEFTTLASLLIDIKFFNETLDLKLLNIFGINDSDNLARFSATYAITDNWKLMGGLSLFSGPDDSFLGQFDSADRVEIELTCNF